MEEEEEEEEEAMGGEAATPMATISLLNFISYIVSVCVCV